MVYATLNALTSVCALGAATFAFALWPGWEPMSPFAQIVAGVAVVGLLVWLVVHDPLLPDDAGERPLSATVVHQVASLFALATLPWVGVAGLLGADLSTRPELYAQVVQIIPVLLLAVLFERRIFPSERIHVAQERWILQVGFVVLVVGPCLAEVFGLLALASHVRWIEVAATVLAASAIPSLLVLVAGPVLVALYEPAAETWPAPESGEPPAP